MTEAKADELQEIRADLLFCGDLQSVCTISDWNQLIQGAPAVLQHTRRSSSDEVAGNIDLSRQIGPVYSRPSFHILVPEVR